MASVASNLARLGIDRERLARRTGLERDRVEAIFAGDKPSSRELILIARYLRLPVDALTRLDHTTSRPELRYRSSHGSTSPPTAEARIIEVGKLLQGKGLVPEFSETLRFDASLDRLPSIELAAIAIRQIICDETNFEEPLLDLVDRIDRAGLASTIVLRDIEVEGAATRLSGRGFIVVADRTFVPRMLFSCAHELAHLALGHVGQGEWLLDGDTIEAFRPNDREERLCDTLASALLMPADSVARFLRVLRAQSSGRPDALTDAEILWLARYFGTSFLVAAMRLEQLRLLPRGAAFALQASIQKRYESPETYAAELDLPPREPIKFPTISPELRNGINEALDRGDISLGRLADVFGYSTSEMADALA